MLVKIFSLITLMIIYDFLKNLDQYYKCNKLINKIDKLDDEDELIEYRQDFLKLTWFVNDESFILETWDNESLPPVIKNTSIKAKFPLFDTLKRGRDMLTEAKGHYKRNLFLAFNPIYWVNKFIKLPSQLVEYIGFDKNSTISKILNVIWWIILIVWWLFTPVIEEYRDMLLNLVVNFFN